MTASDALEKLKLGHADFLARQPIPAPDAERIRDLAEHGQHPHAVVVTCSDSRVVPEILFHCQPGDIFTVRTAGNVVSDIEMGSVEYAVDHLGVRLVVVLGHTQCGAVAGACEGHHGHDGHCGCLDALLSNVAPAVEAARTVAHDDAEVVRRAEDLHIQSMADRVAQNPALRDIAGLRVVAAKYDIYSGQIDWELRI